MLSSSHSRFAGLCPVSPPGFSIEDEHIQETPVDGFEIVQMEFPHLGFFLAFKSLLPVEISIVLGEGGHCCVRYLGMTSTARQRKRTSKMRA